MAHFYCCFGFRRVVVVRAPDGCGLNSQRHEERPEGQHQTWDGPPKERRSRRLAGLLHGAAVGSFRQDLPPADERMWPDHGLWRRIVHVD